MVASIISSVLSNSWLGKVLDGMSLSKYCLFLIFLEALFLVLSFSDYINDFPDDAVCNIDIYADDTTLYSKMITFFLLRFTFVSVDLPYRLALNMTVISELILLCSFYMLTKLQKKLCRTDDPTLVASLETLAHEWNTASLYKKYNHWQVMRSDDM